MAFDQIFPLTMLTGEQWLAFLPILIMSLTAIVGLVLSPLKDFGRLASFSALCVGSLAAMLVLLAWAPEQSTVILDGVIVVDRISQVFGFMIVASGLAAGLMTLGFDKREFLLSEYYALIAFSIAGMLALVSTRNLVFFFIALELLSLSVYILVSMHRHSPLAAEAGLKYFLLGGAASAVLLYGVSLLYGATGTLDMHVMQEALRQQWPDSLPLLPILGLTLISVGFLFKLGAVPFHVWVPDVYTGAATPVTGLMISAVKAAAIGGVLRITIELFSQQSALQAEVALPWVLGAVISASLIFGSFVGMLQTRLKRILAYSTIVHTGYVLLGFLAIMSGGGKAAADAVVSYTLFYVVMNLGAFAVLTMVSPKGSDDSTLSDITGLAKRRPFLAFALSVFLLSMAGIPPTAGFLGKYYLFEAALASGHVGLTIVAVLASLVSAVIYLRPMVHMYMKDSGDSYQVVPVLWWGSAAVLSLALVLTLAMGVVPSWFSGLL